MSPEEYDYLLRKKHSYEVSLNLGLGHRESILTLLDKINTKLSKTIVK